MNRYSRFESSLIAASKSLSENRWGLAHFAKSSEQNVPVPLSENGFRIGSKSHAAIRGLLMITGLINMLTPARTALSQSDIVFMTTDAAELGPSNLVRFDDGSETFAVAESGSHGFLGVTALNDELLVSDYLADSIRRYSPSGSYLGDFTLPGFSPTYLETDSGGNVFTTSFPMFGPSTARRFNSAGAATQSINFGTTRQLAGIDADVNGNIYVAETTDWQMYKHAANGTYLNQISLDFFPRDLAIDEVGNRLYLAAGAGGIKIFDISAAAPSLVGSITTPSNANIMGIHFAAESGTIVATDDGAFGSNDPRGLEYSPSGTLLREYHPTTAFAAFDITTFVPSEPPDYNRNGLWDAADYVVWRKGLPAADGNGNGAVDDGDYSFWQMRFGQPGVMGANAAAPTPNAAVPEPGVVLLLAFGAPGLLLMRQPFRRSPYFIAAAIVASLVAVPPTSAAPLYNIVPLGLDDLEHTQSGGYKYIFANQLNGAGQVRGQSYRFNGGSIKLGESTWLYNGVTTINIGLTGAEYTRNDGYKFSSARQLNEAGQVIGRAFRYNGGSTFLGESVWIYDGATTIDFGLTGSEHTRIDGYKVSISHQLNEAGQVIGRAFRYNGGSTFLGDSAWLYDGATTIDIGLTGAEHTRNDGYRGSYPDKLSEAGQVLGISERYNGGSTELGFSAWLYDGTSTTDISLTGSEHTRNDGYRRSDALQLNEAGQVLGASERYNGGNTLLGSSVWLFNGATTIDISLTGAEHTRNDGYRGSYAGLLNEAGQVAGGSNRFNGGADLGLSAWIYDGATTTHIGLTGVEHTRNDDYRFSSVTQLNEAGQVIGRARRFNGGADLGLSAWIYDGATTTHIGLTGVEHTHNDGYKISVFGQLNEAGHVTGRSTRYNGGSTDLGQSVWLYDGANTIDIGLTGSEHTRSDGYKYSFYPISTADPLNGSGQLIGYSRRYNGGSTQLGQDAWFYDLALDETFPLRLSTRSDGYAYSSAEYLGEDGLVLGTYRLFDALDNTLGNRAFYFTIAEGLHDLGALVDGGLAANGWDYLASAIRANGRGQILGHGGLTSQLGQMAYLLTPAVPEPSTIVLADLGLLDMFNFLQRRIRIKS